MRMISILISACIFFGTSIAVAAPVVTYTTSGSAGSWLLNFSVTNNLGGSNNIYFFGVQAPTTDIAGTPSGWGKYGNTGWWNSSAFSGASDTQYNDAWITGNIQNDVIVPGQTLSGFTAHYTTEVAPTNVSWFAYAWGGTYTGTDHNFYDWNPGFEGIATPMAPVPEPETYVLLLAGLGLFGFMSLRKNCTNM